MCDCVISYWANMVTRLAFVLLLSSCALRPPDDWGVSIEDMEGVGNPDIEECQITFGGEVPMVPCTIELNLEWEI
jgi:hypothetical protein